MIKDYAVTEWLGDYPLENQSLWNKEFSDLEYATTLAEATYKIGLHKYGYEHESNDCGKSFRQSYYVLVQEVTDFSVDGVLSKEVWKEAAGITNIGNLGGAALARFLSKWED